MVSVPLAFTVYRPELLITDLGAPAAVQAGRLMTISHTGRNAAPTAARTVRNIRFFSRPTTRRTAATCS
jgi:hypothetical protein